MKLVPRQLFAKADEMLGKYPLISITGPRQSGKTTFAKQLRPDYRYVSLEDPDNRLFAQTDPRGFLDTFQGGVILDEVQRVPDLFSYLQTHTDARQQNGEYILTGSQNFLLMERITQSLAGRVALFVLLPFGYPELKRGGLAPADWPDYLFQGAYPRVYAQDIAPADFYANYLQTYLERDVRQVTNVKDLTKFQQFVQLLAGRTGQLLNQQNLALELGIDNKTVSAWLSVLEGSYLVYRLRPYHANFNKRIVKSPKLYFYDTGLAAYLLGLRSAADLNLHFARGALFENLVINELLKQVYLSGERPQFYFWNNGQTNEVDLLADVGTSRHAYEIKAGRTIQPAFFTGLQYFQQLAPDTALHLVYGGNQPQNRTGIQVHTFGELFG
jgi:uncharacterized protein